MVTPRKKPAKKRKTRGRKPEPGLGKGRPTKYKPEYCQVAKMIFGMVGTEYDLAGALGVSRSTLFRWKADNPAFSSHWKQGMDAANERVVASFYQRAVGYLWRQTVIRLYGSSNLSAAMQTRTLVASLVESNSVSQRKTRAALATSRA